jgi:hypothetical protein
MPRSYGPNKEVCEVLASGTIKMGDIVEAANTIHFMECQYNSRVHYTDSGSYDMPPAVGVSARRHNEGWNIEFCDGHAKWLKTVSNGMFTIVGGD